MIGLEREALDKRVVEKLGWQIAWLSYRDGFGVTMHRPALMSFIRGSGEMPSGVCCCRLAFDSRVCVMLICTAKGGFLEVIIIIMGRFSLMLFIDSQIICVWVDQVTNSTQSLVARLWKTSQ